MRCTFAAAWNDSVPTTIAAVEPDGGKSGACCGTMLLSLAPAAQLGQLHNGAEPRDVLLAPLRDHVVAPRGHSGARGAANGGTYQFIDDAAVCASPAPFAPATSPGYPRRASQRGWNGRKAMDHASSTSAAHRETPNVH